MKEIIIRKNPYTGNWEHKIGNNWYQGIDKNDNIINVLRYNKYHEGNKIWFYKEIDIPSLEFKLIEKENMEINDDEKKFKEFVYDIDINEIKINEDMINWDIEDNI